MAEAAAAYLGDRLELDALVEHGRARPLTPRLRFLGRHPLGAGAVAPTGKHKKNEPSVARR